MLDRHLKNATDRAEPPRRKNLQGGDLAANQKLKLAMPGDQDSHRDCAVFAYENWRAQKLAKRTKIADIGFFGLNPRYCRRAA